ncbi:NifB/NifX family molybdenum-iron cluster-binding protein [Methanolobus sp. WCC1]|uniref:NifB/NifX family molybdenum-iron cluster-binding protein n=1 Tax=unclassified Methanolobus TaxID=2629569 RepID=UPI003249922C
MKVCVTARSERLDAPADPDFGRCRYFVIVDTDSMEINSLRNKTFSFLGDDTLAAQLLLNRDIDKLITGNIGSKAFSMLSSKGIDVLALNEGSVEDVIKDFGDNILKKLESLDSPFDHRYEIQARGYRRYKEWMKAELAFDDLNVSVESPDLHDGVNGLY